MACRLLSREGEEFELGEAAAGLSAHISDVIGDTHGDTPFPVFGASPHDPLTNASLQRVVHLLEATATMQALSLIHI